MLLKQMVNGSECTVELWIHLRGWLSTQEVRVAFGYRLEQPAHKRFFRA